MKDRRPAEEGRSKYIQKGMNAPFCPSPSFSTLASYSLNSPHTPSFCSRHTVEAGKRRPDCTVVSEPACIVREWHGIPMLPNGEIIQIRNMNGYGPGGSPVPGGSVLPRG